MFNFGLAPVHSKTALPAGGCGFFVPLKPPPMAVVSVFPRQFNTPKSPENVACILLVKSWS
ncbi:hypothetical protein BIY27_17610 [Gibbsiella quercinecans]|nr:hypothetical protein BIY27_17610 [Gibbsiella quercinecans]